jgi:hypothetical protein
MQKDRKGQMPSIVHRASCFYGLNVDMMKQCMTQSVFTKVAHNYRPERNKT